MTPKRWIFVLFFILNSISKLIIKMADKIALYNNKLNLFVSFATNWFI